MHHRSPVPRVAGAGLLLTLLAGLLMAPQVLWGLSVSINPPDKPTYILGETVTIPGAMDCAGLDTFDGAVTLVIEGPQPLTHALPIAAGEYSYPSKNLKVSVNHPYGFGYGYGSPCTVDYVIKWTPPVFLDPPPVFKVIPDADVVFPVPTPFPAATPEPGGPQNLPVTTLAFAVPAIPTTAPDPNAPDPLPGASEAFPIPLLPTPAPLPGVVDLPSVTEAFAIPAIPTPVPDPNAPDPLPAVTAAFEVPLAPTPAPIPGVPTLGDTEKAFDVPTTSTWGKLWDKTFGGASEDRAYSVQRAADGGYVVAGYTTSKGAGMGDAWLVKTDAQGNLEWDRTFGGTQWDYALSVQATADGGYVLAGGTSSKGAGSEDFWLVKTDAQGGLEWDRTFGGTSLDNAVSAQQTADGGYFLAGYTESKGAGNTDFWLVKTDAQGNLEWDRTFGGTSGDHASSAQQTADGGYLLAGVTGSKGAGNADAWLVKTDAQGNLEWDRTFGGASTDVLQVVLLAADGGYLLAGDTDSKGAGEYDLWLLKTDAQGGLEWDRTFGGASTERGFAAGLAGDGGYVLAGYTKSKGAGGLDAWLVKTDAQGNLEWDRTFGSSSHDRVYSVRETAGGGYVLAGSTDTVPDEQAWLIKVGLVEQPAPIPNGIATDGTNFYLLVDGTTSGANDRVLKVGPAPGKIAFSSNRDGNPEVYVMNADGTGATRLTNNASSDIQPAISPDGSRIAFISNRDGGPGFGLWEVYVMNADGTGVTRLSNSPGEDTNPSWSPDGAKIAFSANRDGQDEIYVMDADGSNQTRLTTLGGSEPAWSPDGTKIAFRSDRDGNAEIYTLSVAGAGEARLTSNGFHDYQPAWSPDGAKIAFTSNRTGKWQVHVMTAAGTGQTNLSNTTSDEVEPAWSADGTKIAFHSNRSGVNQVYVMGPGGTDQVQLTSTSAWNGYPSWGPTAWVQLASFPIASKQAEGITYLGGYLYIANNEFWPQKIMKVDPADGTTKSDFDTPDGHRIRGVANDGTRLWLASEWGYVMYKVTTSGTKVDEIWANWQNFNAIAFKDALYTGQAEKVGAWDIQSKTSIQSWFTTLGDIRGMVFKGGVLYIADADTQTVYRAQPPSLVTVTQEPTALAYDGTNLWMVTNGSPRDKLLKLNPSTGALLASFDAPDDRIGGMTVLRAPGELKAYLYLVSNQNRKVFKVDPADGKQISEFSGPGWTDLTAITNDGTDLYLGQKQGRDIYVRSKTGTDKGQVQDWSSPLDGYQGMAFRSLTGDLFGSLGNKVGRFQKSDGKFLESWTLEPADIRGLAFIGDTLYMADMDTGKVYKASIPTGVSSTTYPQGMAYDGANLYVVVDGEPADSILVLDPSDGAIVRSFQAPTSRTTGITYLGTSLYVADNETTGTGQRHIRKLSATDGKELDSFIAPGGGWENMGGLTNNGTDLIVGRANDRQLWRVRASDGMEMESWWGDWNDPRKGNHGLAYMASTGGILAVDGGNKKVVRLTATGQYVQAWTVTSLTDMRGMAFIGDTIYIADGTTMKVYRASVPTGAAVTQDPQGMAYDGANLYIVVDATPKDKILVVDPADGALVDSYDAPSDRVAAITYLGTSLYVADNDTKGTGQRNIRKLDPADGAEMDYFVSPGGGWSDITSLTTNGTDLIAGRQDDRSLYLVRASDGYELNTWFGEWNDPRGQTQGLAFMAATSEFFAMDASKAKLVRLSSTGKYTRAWTMTGFTNVRGLTFAGEVLYLADAATKKVYKASIPSGVEITTIPQGIAYDGATYLYVVVDALPKDKVLVVNPSSGFLVDSYDAPSSKVDGVTYLGGFLYVADNDTSETGQRNVRKLNPANGTEVNSFVGPDGGWEDLSGLSNNGASLLVGRRNDKAIFVMRPSDGVQVQTMWGDWQNPLSSTQGLAYWAAQETMFAASGKKVARLNDQAIYVQSWTTSLLDLRGLTFVGNVLYLADADTESIYKAVIPRPESKVSTTPIDLATDGASLYVLVKGTPRNHVLVVNPANGNVVRDFQTPRAVTQAGTGGAMTFLGGYLYIADNVWPPTISKVDPSDGTEVDSFPAPNQWEVGGMATSGDGTRLVVGPRWDNTLFTIDPASPTSWTQGWPEIGNFPWFWGYQALVQGSLYAVSGNAFVKIDRKDGVPRVTDYRDLGFDRQVEGIALIGTTAYMADAITNSILTTTLPGRRPEITTVGSYLASLKVQETGQSPMVSGQVPFALAKISELELAITQPTEGASFDLPEVTVAAETNDPSINTLFLGTEVPHVAFIEDNVETPAVADQWSRSGLWTRTNQGKSNSGQWAWYYGNVPAFNYETGQANSGNMTSWEMELGENAFLSFATWYNTEGGLDADRKMVQVYGTIGGETRWWNVAQIVDYVKPGAPNPPNSAPGFQFIQVPAAHFDVQGGQPSPVFDWVGIPLGDFRNQSGVRIRIRFDTVNQFINSLEGWYVDDIFLGGSGSRGKAVQRGADGKFTTTVVLGEGVNTINVKAINGYTDPPLAAEASVRVSLDTTDPGVAFVGFQTPSNIPSQEVRVRLWEPNWKLFTLEVVNSLGRKVVAALTQPPSGDPAAGVTVVETVSLYDGQNTITATMEDKAGHTSSATVVVLLDRQGPQITVLPVLYPVGQVSARPGTAKQEGDPVILQVDVADNAAGVSRVYMAEPGAVPGDPASLVPFLWAGNGPPPPGMEGIPQAVRDQWGATGDWVLPLDVPQGTPPGYYTLNIVAVDRAGNPAQAQAQAQVAPVLAAANIYLMPRWNLISLPLIPDSTGIGDIITGARNVSNHQSFDSDPSWSPDGTKLAFRSDRGGNPDIYVMNADGTGLARLTSDPLLDSKPEWSPDGTRIVFQREVGDSDSDVFVMNADGSGQTNLTSNPGPDYAPNWTGDGASIVFASYREPGRGRFIMGANGSGVTSLDTPEGQALLEAAGGYRSQAVSADGSARVYSTNDGDIEVYLQTLATGAVTQLTYNSVEDSDPAISPDGARIAFTSYRNNNHDVYVMNADGTGVARLTDSAAWDGTASWSPNGSKIVYATGIPNTDQFSIVVMNADGSGKTALTTSAGASDHPLWSRDGQKVLFQSRRDGNGEIYIVGASGGGLTNLTNNPAEDYLEAVSPDGARVLFGSYRGGDYAYYTMALDGSAVQLELVWPPAEANINAWREKYGELSKWRDIYSADGSLNVYSRYDGDNEVYYQRGGQAPLQLTTNTANDAAPVITRDGSRVAFVSDRDGNSEIWVLELRVAKALKRIWSYDAVLKQWRIYEPGQPGDLDTLETGKGYWVYMDESQFSMSAPLAPGLPQTPAPIRLTYSGAFLQPATVPPTYNLVAGWNLVGFHGEWPRAVKTYLAGVTYPQRVWANVLRYDNYIRFEKDGPPEIVLGGFGSMVEDDEMEPGRGYWIFLSAQGSIGP